MSQKDYNLDALRVMSMLMVIVIHVANYYCRAFFKISYVSFFGAIIFNSISRISVPIFFMISGALLLNKPHTQTQYFKRITDKIISLVFMTVIYLLWDKYFMKKQNINVISLLFKPERKLLWFMYAIIGIYIALPFIKRMVENMTAKEDLLFVVLWGVSNGIVYFIGAIAKSDLTYPIPIINSTYYLGYFIIGHLIMKYKTFIDFKKYSLLFSAIAFIALSSVVILSFTVSLKQNKFVNGFLAYRSVSIIIGSVCCFLVGYFKQSNKSSDLVSHISSNSFGIYLIHGILLDGFMSIFPYKQVISFIGIPIITLITFILSYTIIYLLRKIPVIKKYL